MCEVGASIKSATSLPLTTDVCKMYVCMCLVTFKEIL